MQRGQKLFGVVVTVRGYPHERFTNKVFVKHDWEGPHIFYVLREAFTLAPDAIQHIEGNEFDIVADIKNQVRKRERPLDPGDWISWYYSGSVDISEFRRETNLHKIRCGNPHFQYLLTCVKSPTDLCLYNNAYGYISIDPKESRKLLPNIAFEAWVDVYIEDEKTDKLVLMFAKYVRSEYKMQIHVFDTPWVEHHKVDNYDPTSEDDLEFHIEPSKKVDKDKMNNVYDVLGYYIADRSMYLPNKPDLFFILPYVDERILVPGLKYRFDAYWNETENMFIVGDMTKLEDIEPLHTLGEAGEKILVLDSVNQRMDFKSLFHASKFSYGIMDDPTGVLAWHHLSRYAESKCRVYFYEDRLCSFGRFRIEKIDYEKAKKIEKNVEETVKEVRGVKGVVISSDGRVFSPVHSPLRIFLPQGINLPIGTHVVFTATVDYEAKSLVAMEDTLKVLREEEPIEHFEFNGRLIFKTTGDWTARGDDVSGIVSPHFSLLDDPLKLCPRPTSKVAPIVKVWVAESGTDERGERRIAQTPFFIVAATNHKPVFKKPKFVDCHDRDIGGFIMARDGSLTEMETPKEAKPIAGKFSRPGASRGVETPILTSVPPPIRGETPILHSVPPPIRGETPILHSVSRPVSSVSSSPLDICGCATKRCAAKKIIVDLMNNQNFLRILHTQPDGTLMDKVMECIF